MDNNDGRFPGGPTTAQIIDDRKAHRCEQIWKENVDSQQKSTQYHGQMIAQALREEGGLRRDRLDALGFGPISRLNWTYTDVNLCFAVAERFWPRTSTFHFPCGEMAITVDDTARILGLPVIGRAVISRPCDDYIELVTRCLGRIPENLAHQAIIANGRIEIRWLIEEFNTLPADATPMQVDYYTRAYILALCGCCMFPNASGKFITLKFMTILEDLDGPGYAWGAAVLAYLYTSMKEFVLSDKYDLRGCVVLLQVWAHLHFPAIGTPVVREGAQVTCLAENYCGRNRIYTADPHHTLVYYRQEFDLLTANNVVWAPYPLWQEPMEQYIAHRSCIICLKDVHYHPGDRCMRQLRFFQDIPGEPMSWSISRSRRKPTCDVARAEEDWNAVYLDDSPFRLIGRRLANNELSDGVSQEYKLWYGRPVIYNPNVVFPEPRFTPRGYGDPTAAILWERQLNMANAIERLYPDNSAIGEPWRSLRGIVATLRSTEGIPQVPQERFVAPMREVRFHNPPVQEEAYVPGPPEEENPMNFPEQTFGASSSSQHPQTSPYFPEQPYGASSSSQHAQTPPYMTPPPVYFEPSQDVQPDRRPRRNVRRVDTHVLLCPECTRHGNHRCPIHQ